MLNKQSVQKSLKRVVDLQSHKWQWNVGTFNLATALLSGFLAGSVVYRNASVLRQACSKGPVEDSSSLICSNMKPACTQYANQWIKNVMR